MCPLPKHCCRTPFMLVVFPVGSGKMYPATMHTLLRNNLRNMKSSRCCPDLQIPKISIKFNPQNPPPCNLQDLKDLLLMSWSQRHIQGYGRVWVSGPGSALFWQHTEDQHQIRLLIIVAYTVSLSCLIIIIRQLCHPEDVFNDVHD